MCKQIMAIPEFDDNMNSLIKNISNEPTVPGINFGFPEKYDVYQIRSIIVAQIIESAILNNHIKSLKNSATRILTILKNADIKDSYFIYEQHTNNPNYGLKFHYKYLGRNIFFPMSPADIMFWNYDGGAIEKTKFSGIDSTDLSAADFDANKKIIFSQYDQSASKIRVSIFDIFNELNIKNHSLPFHVGNKTLTTSNLEQISEKIIISGIRELFNYSSNYKTIYNPISLNNKKVENIIQIFPNCIHSFIHSKNKNIDVNEKINKEILKKNPSLNYDLQILKFKKSLIKMIRLELYSISQKNTKFMWDQCNEKIKDYLFQIFFIDLLKYLNQLIMLNYAGSEITKYPEKYFLSIDRSLPSHNFISLIEKQLHQNSEFKSYTIR